MLNYLFFISIFQLTTQLITENNVNLDILNKNLFDSLKLHPKLENGKLTNETKKFIDKYVDDYYDLTSHFFNGKTNGKSKRSVDVPPHITRDHKGVKVFGGLHPSYIEPTFSSNEFEFFKFNHSTYFAAIDVDKKRNHLFLFTYETKKIKRAPNLKAPRVIKFSLLTKINTTYFVVNATDDYYSGVWVFNGKGFKQVQNIDTTIGNLTDLKIWSNIDGDMYAAYSFINTNSGNKTIIYKWFGLHFDPIQTIYKEVVKILEFTRENYHFLVLLVNDVSNLQFAEIYLYHAENDQYEIHQRIPTNNCKDLKYFIIQKHKGFDSFIGIANYITGKNEDDIPPLIYRYVDGFFLPFQNLEDTNVLQFEYLSSAAEFLLIVRREFQPLNSYQYDGWMFQQSKNDINKYLSNPRVNFIRAFFLEIHPILVVGYSDVDSELELYHVNFTSINYLETFYTEYHNWCTNTLKRLNEIEFGKILDKRSATDDDSTNSEEIKQKIGTAKLMLEQLETQAENSLQTHGNHVFNDLEVGKIILNDTKIRSISTETLNDENISEILENSIDINEDSEWPEGLKIENVQIDSKINPKRINGRKSDEMVHLSDNLELNELNIIGTTVFSEPIITQTLNNIKFDDKTILMNNLNQKFDNLNVENLRIDNINPQRINDKFMKDFESKSGSTTEINRIKNIKSKNVIIGGLLNDVDMKTLDKYALRISGDQIITKKYYFEELEGRNMKISKLSGKKLDDNLVLINSDGYKLKQDVQFSKHLKTDQLIAKKFIDSIPVIDGKLQILLKDSRKLQKINAIKIFNDVELLNPINLQGNLQSEDLEKINPTITIDGPLLFTGDFEIRGNTSVEKLLKTGDFSSPNSNNTAKKILSHGLSLREKEIPMHLNFQQQLNVQEIFIDNVNGLNPQKWVLTGTNFKQTIHGAKIFINDVIISGNTNFFKINNIDIPEFENSILRNNGDQVITGKHTIVNVVGQKVLANRTKIGEIEWENLLTTETNQVISGKTFINGAVKTNVSKSETTKISENINKFNFTQIVDDTVSKNSEKFITGHKNFRNLTMKNVKMSNFEIMDKKNVIYDGNLSLKNSSIENIAFGKTCNGENKETFGEQHFEEKLEEIVLDPRNYDNFVVYGNVYIESGFLNEVNLEEFVENTVKIDEENSFEDVTFEGTIISETPIKLLGHIENVDLENLLLSNSTSVQKILEKKTFKNNVTVFGKLELEGKINDFDLNQICSFVDSGNSLKELEIHGNAFFTKGPNAHKIHNIDVEDINENAWFKNKPKKLENSLNFTNIKLFDNVTVAGSVDGVNLNTLKTQYFSKSKDQNLNLGMFFANNVEFEGNLISPKMSLNGAINGTKISELPRTMLLQDEDQMFEENVFMDTVKIEDLQGEYTINNLNPETDLMRYDKENIITGIKKFDRLIVNNADLKNGTQIQNVDILDWMQEAVLKKGIFNVKKRKIFKENAHFGKGIYLQGVMNGEFFTNETIMLKSVPQNITAVKRFEVDKMELMRFKNLKLRGLMNDLQISEFMDDQVGNNDMVLKSPMQFNNGLFAKNLNIENYKNINVTKFISDVLELEKMDDLLGKYGNLLNASRKIQQKLRDHALYLQYYKETQVIKSPDYIVNSCCEKPFLLHFDTVNDSYIMNFLYWDENRKEFSKYVEQGVNLGYRPLNIQTFSSGRQQFLYMEYPNNEGYGVMGQLWKFDSYNQPYNCGSIILSKGVRQILPITIEESECLLFIYKEETKPLIFCNLNLNCEFNYNQCLEHGKYLNGAVTKINDIQYIILVRDVDDDLKNPQGNVEIWCLHDKSFGIRQVLLLSDPPPKSVATITYKKAHFLSVVYRNNFKQGHVDILKYSTSTGQYEQWQKITLDEPIRAEFAILPSDELLFFVLNSRGTLTVFKYEGIARFNKLTSTSTLSDIKEFKQFVLGTKHFVMIENDESVRILKAQFKGNLEESN